MPLPWLTLVCLVAFSEAFPNFVPEIPDSCRNWTVCEDVPNYPYDHVNNIIQELDPKHFGYENDGLVTTATDAEEFQLCKSKKMYLAPKAAKTKSGEWKFIINQDTSPLQHVIVEICDTNVEDSSCGNGINVTFHRGYTTRCKQKHMYRYMLGLNKRGSVSNIIVIMPICCSCVASKDFPNPKYS